MELLDKDGLGESLLGDTSPSKEEDLEPSNQPINQSASHQVNQSLLQAQAQKNKYTWV
jgi:hypothetical protein